MITARVRYHLDTFVAYSRWGNEGCMPEMDRTLKHGQRLTEKSFQGKYTVHRTTKHNLPKLKTIRRWVRMIKQLVHDGYHDPSLNDLNEASMILTQYGWVIGVQGVINYFSVTGKDIMASAAAKREADEILSDLDYTYYCEYDTTVAGEPLHTNAT